MEEGEELQFKKASSSRRRPRKSVGDEHEGAGGKEEGAEEVAVVAFSRPRKRGLASGVGGGSAGGLESVVYAGKEEDDEDKKNGGSNKIAVAAEVAKSHEAEAAAAAAAGGSLQAVVGGEKVYAGEKARASFFRTSDAAAKGTAGLKAGPIKASNFIKSATLIDYNPSVCKDYKQTGFCGYGLNCIYVHDRGDYKSGWEIDKEWAAKQKNINSGEEENYEVESSDEDNDNLPFACLICRNDFVEPVVTKCGHYFCESCALDQEKKTKRCAVCNEPTAGIFNQPKALIEKLAKRGK